MFSHKLPLLSSA